MKHIVKKGQTSYLVCIFIQDSSSTTGAGLTGLTNASSGLVCYRARADDGNAGGTQITLSGGTRGTWSSGGFVEKDATNMPGVYELGIPDAALATGSNYCIVMLKGATNMAPLPIEFQLVAYDPLDAVHLGLSSLPNTAVTTNASLLTSGTGTDQLSVTSGRIDAGKWLGGTIPAPNVTGVPKVDVIDWLGTAVAATVNSLIPAIFEIASGSITSATNNTATTNAPNANDGFYKGLFFGIIGGTGAGQVPPIISYNGTTKTFTVVPNWVTNPDGTSMFALFPACMADVVAWNETAVTAATAGIPDVNSKLYNNQTAQTDANNLPKVDIEDIVGAAVSTTTAQLGVNAVKLGNTTQTGRDIGASVLLSAGTGTGQLDFTSGVVKANLAQILGTALTETAGQIAAAFKKVFDVASPVFTATSVNQTGDAYARLGAPAGASTAADIAALKADLDGGVTLTAAERNSTADALLNRDMSAGTDSGSTTVRTVRQALRFLRNKWAISTGTLTVYKEDDSTSSWTATVSTDGAAVPIVGNDPAGP